LLQLAEEMLEKQKLATLISLRSRGHEMATIKAQYDGLINVARGKAAAGHFDNVPYSLYHIDLSPRNVLAKEHAAPDDRRLTGIID